ncbi:MAG: SGNH/GDSL hydrolase family protein [Planctomycetaceae bacterium]
MAHAEFPRDSAELDADPAAHGALAVGVREFVLILIELATLVVVVRQFHLDELHHLPAAMMLVTAGFAVHAWLPFRHRLSAFLVLSLAGLVLVLGPGQASRVLAVGAVLLSIASLPLPRAARVALLLVATAGLVWLRRGSDAMFWPIAGSMFMFRLIVYMHSEWVKAPSGWRQTLAYFLLLPNAFFPLFPVVDYQTFCTTYYDASRREIYQKGVHWMTVGIVHLLLYRLIRHEFLPLPLEIRSVRETALFFALTYALYLRVSGQFHIICGMLHLFGFHLPRTHNEYFLASSFSDLWRRINIYWKDFMKGVFFFPAVFRLRRLGKPAAVGLAVLWVFFWTWLAHSAQVYWLLGQFPVTIETFALWMAAGVVLSVNAMVELKRTAPATEPARFSVWRAAVHVLKVVAVFSCVSVFWMLWSNADTASALFLSAFTMGVTRADLLAIGGVVGLAVLGGVAAQFVAWRISQPGTRNRLFGPLGAERLTFDRSVALHLLPLIALLIVAQPPVYRLFNHEVSRAVADLQVEKVTRGDVMALIDGYYEQLNEGSLQAGPFLKDPVGPADRKGGRYSAMVQPRRDLLAAELIPGWAGEFSGARVSVNRWGMRDGPRVIAKPSGVYRIAVLGSSVVMGFGVNDDETFSRLLEARLKGTGAGAEPIVEVLNFGMGQHFLLQRCAQLAHKALAFSPDLVVYVAHQDEYYTAVEGLPVAIRNNVDLEDPCLTELVQTLGLGPQKSEGQLSITLNLHFEEVACCTYRRMVELCRAHDARLLYVYIPVPGNHDLKFDPKLPLAWAQKSGIDVVDLTGWWTEHSLSDVVVGSGDTDHPNAFGHQVLAEKLEALLRQRCDVLHSP